MSTTDTTTRSTTTASAPPSGRRRRTADAPALVRRGLLYLTLTALLIVFILPMLWALSGSFKQRGDIFATPPSLIPDPATLENYWNLLTTQPFWSWFAISIGTAGIATVVSVFVCAMAGYGFAKFRFRGKRILFAVMFSSLSIPFAVILIPLFILVVKSGLANPWFALIVPWVAPAFGIFMMQQFIVQAIPDELLESARIDGSSEFGTFRRVVLPLLRPSLGALGVWSFLQSYNAFMWPLVIISNSQQYTLPLGLNVLYASENRSYDLVLAGAVLASIPTILVFILLRKQLLEGLVAGAVKG